MDPTLVLILSGAAIFALASRSKTDAPSTAQPLGTTPSTPTPATTTVSTPAAAPMTTTVSSEPWPPYTAPAPKSAAESYVPTYSAPVPSASGSYESTPTYSAPVASDSYTEPTYESKPITESAPESELSATFVTQDSAALPTYLKAPTMGGPILPRSLP
jgi:hypothetical protein